ncbi:hypothetical protein [Spirillospora sp. CA-294931]|uniref:hypothetical protein n=1 Tax=Spirillospora sp. CA-294931 TaxID=3240042 RepID=UPI003D8AFF54
MVKAKVEQALRRLGVGPDAATAYLALLELAPIAPDGLAAAIGLDERRLAAACDELAETGLAHTVSGAVVPVPPAAGLEILRRHRAAELDESRIAVAGAFESFRRTRLEYDNDLVEVVTGDGIGLRLRQAWASARKQIRQFDSPPYFPIPSATQDALATLARGVDQRVIYSRDSLEQPGYIADCIEPFIEAGEQARVLPSVPVKLVIIDDAYALVSLSIKEADRHTTMLVVQPSGLLSALTALFELSWHNALPFHGSAIRPQRLLPADRRLLALLAAGVPDDDIARELDVSRRTLFRRMEILMARLGATTRFQMALQAQRRGWV